MVETSKSQGFLDSIRTHAHVGSKSNDTPVLPLHSPNDGVTQQPSNSGSSGAGGRSVSGIDTTSPEDEKRSDNQQTAAALDTSEDGAQPSAMTKKLSIPGRIYKNARQVLLASYVNILLIFVPIGIAVQVTGQSPVIVFSMNAIAIIPLAGLLSYATESVASSLGDTVGALLNVTFGNAVELIIFIIALVKDEINIVQASLVGSILSNLLLILGMCFFLGGLRYREQIYNSTVTQMSACLLSLSVVSLVLPTAFHASFSDQSSDAANAAVLKVSRGTSVILLLIYILYLLFQLKSHAYMYESTPQHIIDEESHPGVLADMLDSSSSDSSSSSSDSDTTSGSHTTAKKIRRALRRRTRRKSSASSKEHTPSALYTPSVGTFSEAVASPTESRTQLGAIASGDEADDDAAPRIGGNLRVHRRDFGEDNMLSPPIERKKAKKNRKNKKQPLIVEIPEETPTAVRNSSQDIPPSPRVAFAQANMPPDESFAQRRQFTIRPLVAVRPTMPKMLSHSVFSSANPTGTAVTPVVKTVPKAPYGLRRTLSLPDRLNRSQSAPAAQTQDGVILPAEAIFPHQEQVEGKGELSRFSAVVLLLISTGLVAVCAEFLVNSIDYMVANTAIGEVFIGLILLPIIGNAAEHVTAVTVATKNKMDLAIGVAVGSSIQIALFVTPIVVLLGWILNRDMSLYFSLFETMTLFASAFIVNFLVLDGRSNYLEGVLLMAAYIIIALGAFFYPDADHQSAVGGGLG